MRLHRWIITKRKKEKETHRGARSRLTDVKTKWAGSAWRGRVGRGCPRYRAVCVLHLSDWWARSMRITAGSRTYLPVQSSPPSLIQCPAPRHDVWVSSWCKRALPIGWNRRSRNLDRSNWRAKWTNAICVCHNVLVKVKSFLRVISILLLSHMLKV